MSEAGVREAFEFEGSVCRQLGAPLSARLRGRLAELLDRSTATGRRVLDWPGEPLADALPVRLAAGLHALVRAGALPALATHFPPQTSGDDAGFDAALTSALHDERLLPWLDGAPQTNEVGCSGVLLPGMLTIAAATGLPLRLFELGASAGLNLRMDAYAYRFGDRHLTPPDAPLTLCPAWEGSPPPLAPLTIIARRGVDLAPVDLSDAAARNRLLAYVWPEQVDRAVRLEAAIVAFRADPALLDHGDAAAWVASHVTLQRGSTAVVYHSIAWQYFPATTQAAISAHLDALGATATVDTPLAWLRYEFDAPDAPATLRLRLWPGGGDRLLAHAHPHGASVQWLG